MKVLFLSSWYPTAANPNLGIFVKEHAKAIHSTDNEIIVLAIVVSKGTTCWNKTEIDFIDENGIRTIIIEINSRFRDLIYHAIPLQYCFVKRTFNKKISPAFSPDIIHSNVIFPAGIIGDWLADYLKKPHVITEHWTQIRRFAKTPLLSYFGKKAFKKCSKILPVSNFLKNEIIDSFQIEKSKFIVVGNVIDSKTFSYKEKEINSTRLSFCSIATWDKLRNPAKQPELLINALSLFQKTTDKEITLTLIGGGNKVEELKKLCLDKNVNANFTGYLTKTEIAKNLYNSDFFVHPTKIETFGVVIVEALMTGTPVICSSTGALQELIDENNGVLCENSVEDWVSGIRKAMEIDFNHLEIARKVQSKFSMEIVGNKINKIYNSIS